MQQLGEFVRAQFDKLLLSLLFLITLGLTIHTLHHAPDGGSVTWLQNTVGQVLAALLTLMVGRGLQRSADNKANGVPPKPAPETKT